MDPERMKWALVTKGNADEVKAAAHEAWRPLTSEPPPHLERMALPEGVALVGDSRDTWELLPEWGSALARLLGTEVLILDLRLGPPDPAVWSVTAKGRAQARRRDALVEARRIGLLPPEPPDETIAIVEGATVPEVEEALRAAQWKGLPLLLGPHPRGILVRTNTPTTAPMAAARVLSAAFPRVWSCTWSGNGAFRVRTWSRGSPIVADWGRDACGQNEQVLALLGVENSPDAARAALQVTNPPAWKGA